MKTFDDSRIERRFRLEQEKSFEEKRAEEFFREMPVNPDGTRTLHPPRKFEDLNDLMLPQNTRLHHKKTPV